MKTRMYCVVNQYIAGIHAGIQSAHAMSEMFVEEYVTANKEKVVVLIA